MDTTAPTPQVLVIGLDPYRVPGPWDPKLRWGGTGQALTDTEGRIHHQLTLS